MKNTDVKLILLDLDGTLLDGQSKVPANFNEIVDKLKEKDIIVGIASGRNLSAITPSFPNTHKKMAIVSSNGTSVHLNDNKLFGTYFEPEYLKEIIEIAKPYENETSLILMRDDAFIAKKGDKALEWFENEFASGGIKVVDDLNDEVENITVACITSLDMKSDNCDKFASMQDKITIVDSGYGSTDFIPKGYSKAVGAAILCEKLGIDMKNVMAIGDAGNDADLLEKVGYPVAMKNGNDRVKAIAKYITDLPNTENGCLSFIEKFFNI